MMAQGKAYPVQRMCALLAVGPSGYYAWRHRQDPSAQRVEGSSGRSSRRQMENARILAEMRRIDAEVNHRYGSPRMHAELANRGLVYNRKRVARLMRQHGIRAIHSKRRRRMVTTQSNHNLPVAANVLNREFAATMPNQKWVTDITYIPTYEGWLYLAVVLDLFSRKVVGWAMDTQMTTALPLQALRMALNSRRPQSGLLHHSDRGSQYASYVYQAVLQSQAIQPSMSRTANCYDNAVMESFFASLKAELVHCACFVSVDQARLAIFHYIEAFYNRKRLHSSLGYLSPNAYEAKLMTGC
jgi:transposase InsO family protein